MIGDAVIPALEDIVNLSRNTQSSGVYPTNASDVYQYNMCGFRNNRISDLSLDFKISYSQQYN